QILRAGQVLGPAVHGLLARCDARAQDAPLRQVHVQPADPVIVVAAGDLRTAAELAGGRTGDEVDGAAFGVAAEQRALRAAQHFDALDVDHVHDAALSFAEIHVVEIQTDRRIHPDRRLARHRAADAYGRDAGGARVGAREQVWRRGAEVECALHAAGLELLGGDGGDR